MRFLNWLFDNVWPLCLTALLITLTIVWIVKLARGL